MFCNMNEIIRQLRISRGYNQVEFARLLGVTKQCVSNWENDNVVPSIEMLVNIADIFNVTTDFILGRSDITSINVSGLTKDQIAHISLIVDDLKTINNK